MITIMKESNNPYYEYLKNHINNVRKTWEIQLKPHIPEIYHNKISDLCISHDSSKYRDDEYLPYLRHFYPDYAGANNLTEDELNNDYNNAWNHHQKTNPHHWQYWVLIKDSGKIETLDMPLEYVIEMLCDWQSMGYVYGDTAYEWYNSNKDKMIMSDNTRKIVEKYIVYLKNLI